MIAAICGQAAAGSGDRVSRSHKEKLL